MNHKAHKNKHKTGKRPPGASPALPANPLPTEGSPVPTTNPNAQPYRVLFVGELVQDSAMSVGGAQPGENLDDPFCRDGRNRPTLRGSGLAGALLRTARTLYAEADLADITGVQAGGSDSRTSLWRITTAHPLVDQAMEPRQGVGIRQDTGAAAKGKLFDVETLPRDVRWPFCLEVNLELAGGERAARIAAAALLEWTRGRCWLGRNVARGMGWLHLDKLHAFPLTADHLTLWPVKAGARPPETLDEFCNQLTGVSPIVADEFPAKFALPLPTSEWYYLEVSGSLRAGPSPNGYGWDALAVGGHESLRVDWDRQRFVKPRGLSDQAAKDAFNPDAPLALSRGEPFIPGSGLRGPLRHALSRRRNAAAGAEVIRDPNKPDIHASADSCSPADPVAALFGNMDCSAALLIRDAYARDEDWRLAWLQHHAEDEFSASTFEDSKFNRLMVLQGEFEWRLILEGPDHQQVEQQWEELKAVLHYGEHNHLAVGGGQWRGTGWLQWTIESKQCHRAGEMADPDHQNNAEEG